MITPCCWLSAHAEQVGLYSRLNRTHPHRGFCLHKPCGITLDQGRGRVSEDPLPPSWIYPSLPLWDVGCQRDSPSVVKLHYELPSRTANCSIREPTARTAPPSGTALLRSARLGSAWLGSARLCSARLGSAARPHHSKGDSGRGCFPYNSDFIPCVTLALVEV